MRAIRSCGYSLAVFALIVFGALAVSVPAFANEEALARQAEQAGELRTALTHYVSALQSTSAGSAKDQQLREKIITLAQKIQPPPAVQEEARRFSVRGQTAIREAKKPSDYEEAAEQFGKALRIAPWWAEAYFNLGVAQDKAGQLTEAIRSLELYLLAAPSASDTRKVQDQIYALEYKREKARKEVAEKRDAEEQRRREAARPVRLAGEWCFLNEDDGSIYCGHPAKIKVVGSTIEIRIDNENQISGHIQGNKISGFNYHSRPPMREDPCKSIRTPMTGIVSNDGQRIELSIQEPNGWTCTTSGQIQDLRTKSWKPILIRKVKR